MGILDTVYTYRFLRILSMKWESTDAYKLGIVDKDGNPLKKSKDLKTQEEKDSYTSFIRLVFKFKRMLTKIPAGKSAVVRYGAALALIKENRSELEEMGVNMKKIKDIIIEYTDKAINEEVTNSTEGVAGKEQPLGKGKKGSLAKRKKGTCKSKDGKCKGGDDVEVNNSVKDTNETSTSKYHYQVINGIVIRVDEKRRVLKKRIIGGKRQKKREYASGKKSRFTRTGKRKLRSGTKVRFKHAHKKAYRKAHTASAEAKRRRSRRKRKIYAK